MIITVNGVDKSSMFVPNSLSVDGEVSTRSTARLRFADKAGTFHPLPGQPVEVRDNANNLIFGGMVEEPEEENPMFTSLLYIPISCVDQSALADRWLVAESYDDQTCGYIVNDLITRYLAQEGVTVGTIQDGPSVVRAVFPYVKVSQALNELAELAGFSWWISADKTLHFVSRDTNKAPWNITDTSPIRGVRIRSNKSQYRNRQYIRAGQDVTDLQTESFKGDGEQQTFTIGFKVAKVPVVKVNGVEQSVGIRGVEDGKAWYWNKNEKEITQERTATPLKGADESAGTPADVLTIDYYGYFPILVVADETSQISARKSVEGGSGIYEYIEEQPSIDNADAALDIARGKLRKYGRINRELTFETDKTGLQAGQLIIVDLPIHNVYNASFLIYRVSISDYTPDGDLRYNVHAVDGEAMGGWETLFKTLARQGGTFTIRENEVLVKLKTMRDTVGSGDSLNISKAAPESRVGFAMIGYSEVN
jgi:hypothetical protein